MVPTPSTYRRERHDCNSHECYVLPRVVACGAVRGSRGWRLRATLALMPSDQPGGPRIQIAQWPMQIASKLLPSLTLRISPVKQATQGRPRPQPDPSQPEISWRRLGLAPGEGRHAQKVLDLWQRAMAPCNSASDPWEDFLSVLRTGAAGTAPQAAKGTDGSAPPAATPTAPPGAEDEMQILSVPRSDAALLMSLMRARDATQRFRHAKDPHQRAAFGVGWDHCGYEPWMGESRDASCEQSFLWRPTGENAPAVSATAGAASAASAAPGGPTSSSRSALPVPAEQFKTCLAADRQHADALRRSHAEYLAGIDPAKALDRKRCAPSPIPVPGDVARDIAKASEEDVRVAQSRVRNLHSASTARGEGDDPDRDSEALPVGQEAAMRRLMTLHSQPLLQRLFDLTVDIEFELAEGGLLAWLEQFKALDDQCVPHSDPAAAQGARSWYLHIGATWSTTESPAVWTTAKLSLPPAPSRSAEAHFWPCTNEEIDLRLSSAAACSDPALRAMIELRDGVVDLGAQQHCGGPRWDLTTLDPMAIETDIQSSRADRTALANGGPARAVGRATLRTSGISLVDRGRQSQAMDEAAAQLNLLKGGPPVLDAKALCTGYRMDVGVPKRNSPANYIWRSLNDRTVRFGDPTEASSPWIDEVLKDCFRNVPDEVGPALRTLAAGQVRTPTRLVKLGKSETVGFAEETVALWQGDLLGIQSGKTSVVVDARHDLAIHTRYGLPSTQSSPRPPLLRLGWRYRIGLRPVFAGGVSLPLSKAESAYETAMNSSLALPDTRQCARRFLRHERMEAPLLTLLYADIQNLRRQGRLETPTAPVAIVRSANHAEDAALTTASAHRILVAPVVPEAFASWHGVFDSCSELHPPDGLRGVEFECEPGGGFPMLDSKYRTTNDPEEAVRTDAVFKPRGGVFSGRRERLPYYPDPAVRGMVLALRHRRGNCSWLHGQPIKVDLYAGGALAYPNPAVVLVEVEASGRASGATQAILQHDRLRDVGVLDAQGRFRTASLAGWGPASAEVPAVRVRILLAPGEDFDLVSWFVSDAATLYRWFDIVESAALVCDSLGCTLDGGGESAQPMARGFKVLCGGSLPKLQVGPATGGVTATSGPLCGSGGLPLPEAEQVRRMSIALHREMVKRPVPEVASWSVLRVVHAVSRPVVAPRFADSEGQEGIKVLRTNFRDETTRLRWLAKNPVSSWKTPWPGKWKPSGSDHPPGESDPDLADAATDVLIGGSVLVELNTTGGIEIEGEMPFPAHGRFDDPARRMTEAERARGVFPSHPEQTWGFKVDIEGNVTLPRTRVCMLRLDDLEKPSTASERVEGREPLDVLFSTTAVALGSSNFGPPEQTSLRRPTSRHVFADTKARHVTLSMTAYSRFGEMMGEARGRKARHTSITDEKNTIGIWIPSMKRPDRIDPRTLVPTFVWSRSDSRAVQVERRCRIRLRLQRPWFSSGEGERLGLVVWPHDLKSRHSALLAGNVAPGESGPDRVWDSSFDDAALGRGGSYVTRWGADPIRKGPVPQGWFMPREAFRDLDPSPSGEPARAEWISGVNLPIPGGDEFRQGGDPLQPVKGGSPERHERFLKVSLLAYVPKFDWREEQWYVDLDIDPLDLPDPFVRLGLVRYQPNAHPDLQVSEPVVEWVQPMPRRTVSVVFGKRTGDGYPVTVEVRGRGSLRAGNDQAISLPHEEGPHVLQRHRPVVRMRVMQKDKAVGLDLEGECVALDSGGQPLEWDSGLDHDEGGIPQPRRTNEGLSWTHTFLLAEDPDASGAGKFAVFVEEVERRRHTTYRSADGNEETNLTKAREDRELAESGARFMAHVPLRRKEGERT